MGDWADRKREGAAETWATARAALKQVNEALAAGRTLDAQRAALTCAIMTDKSGALEAGAAEAERRRVAVAEADAEKIADVFRGLLADLGLPLTASVRRALAARLRGEEDSEAAEAAAREVRQHFTPPEAEPTPPVEPLALPPPPVPELPEHVEDRESDEMAGPSRRVRVTPVEDEGPLDGEIVDAELVPDHDYEQSQSRNLWRPSPWGRT